MTITIKEKLALEEMRRSFDLNDNSSDVLDQKASSILGNSSVIIGIFMTLHIALITTPKTTLYWMGILLLLGTYLVLVILCASAFWPTNYRRPIQINWETISTEILSTSAKNVNQRLISSYINCINYNKEKNNQKATRIKIASFLMFAIICILGIISIVPNK